MDRLPAVDNPKYLVFTDFDETYLSHKMEAKDRMTLKKLETFLQENCQSLRLLFGFVTGSSFSNLMGKMEKYDLKVLPHFIACSLGSELSYECDKMQGRKDQKWESHIKRSFYRDKVLHLVNSLQNDNISLVQQPSKYHTDYKISYYYFDISCKNISRVKNIIEKKTAQVGLGVNISACNPCAGDPEGAYDIDFIPQESGKHNFVRMFLHKYRIHKQNAYAFGDSENDIKMLKAVEHGYAVANTIIPPTKRNFRMTEKSYAGGILEVLSSIKK